MLSARIDRRADATAVGTDGGFDVRPGCNLVAPRCDHICFAGFENPGFDADHLRSMAGGWGDFGMDEESMGAKSVCRVTQVSAVWAR